MKQYPLRDGYGYCEVYGKVLKEYDEISFRIQELSDFIAKVDNHEIDISEVQDYNLLVKRNENIPVNFVRKDF